MNQLIDQNCHWLTSQAQAFALTQVRCRRWRGAFGGLLPDGYDPQSIAAEAIAQLATTRRAQLEQTLDPPARELLLQELHRLVLQQVDRLYRRKENWLLRNEADLPPVLSDEGEPMSVIEALPAPDPSPLEALLLKEENHQCEQFQASLAKERRLQKLFSCLLVGISKPKALARKLHLSTQAILNLRQRLQRRCQEFLQVQSSAKISLEPKKLQAYSIVPQALTPTRQKIALPDAKIRLLASI